ncbi:pre-rRNA-processing TSR2 -like protein [Brachionus plicatilis]|uniref:Pre-rRNA-processing protein TSR2 homolog n=1 Tax=Brachionus plicatilis TaxID=10195 RepID=A0A3M7T0B3_BRAPC|nr:pre-rRNA-processing TSR2 -like protein [Brachionus plicatilis]
MNDNEFVVNASDPFYIAAKTVFDNWTALQLAISNDFAGSETKDIAEWFLNATYQWIVETGDLEDDELEEFFFNTMNNEFNTILDDNSCLQIARLLTGYYGLYKANRLQELHDELMKRYAAAQGSIQASQKCKTEQDTSSEESGDEELDVEMADETKPKNVLSEQEAENFEQVDEGWTFVTKTGKKLTK